MTDRLTARPPDRPTAGFTLIEVLTALALTGVVALLAHRLLSVTVDAVHQLDQARLQQDRRENARRWLRAAFLSLEAGGEAGSFEGLRDRVTFTTWQQQPGGWMAPQRITLSRTGKKLIATGADFPPLGLADSVPGIGFDYLLEPGADVKWVREWLSPLSAPIAVRLRIAQRRGEAEFVDTLLLLIKARG